MKKAFHCYPICIIMGLVAICLACWTSAAAVSFSTQLKTFGSNLHQVEMEAADVLNKI